MTTPTPQPADTGITDATGDNLDLDSGPSANVAITDAYTAHLALVRDPKMAAFLTAYGETGLIGVAAKRAGIHRQTHRNWLAGEGAQYEAYRAAWDDAREDATERLEGEMRRRAADGWDEGVYYHGERVGEERRYSDTLLIFALKGARPDVYRDNAAPTVNVAVAVQVDL